MSGLYQLEDIAHCYGRQTVLNIDRLAVQRHDIVGLVGPNGSGKSSLLRLLGFIERPTRGSLLFKGRPAGPFDATVRFQVTLLPQEPYLMKRSVFDNVAYGLRLRHDRHHVGPRVAEALSMVGLTAAEFARRGWNELSGGEAQRVALAARLALQPQVLLLDEPTASVDGASAQMIRGAALAARRNWGTTLVIASHDWHWLYDVCDQVLHLFRGRLLKSGTASVIYGPWHRRSDGQFEKKVHEQQFLRAPPPPDPLAVALIASSEIHVLAAPITVAAHDNLLKGQVSQLVFEKASQMVLTTVLVGSQPFNLNLTVTKVQHMRLYPGCPLWLHFPCQSVRWHKS